MTTLKPMKSPYGPDFVQITQAKMLERVTKGVPGVVIVSYAHDDWCPTLKGGGTFDCQCNPDQTFWLDMGGDKQ